MERQTVLHDHEDAESCPQCGPILRDIAEVLADLEEETLKIDLPAISWAQTGLGRA